MLKYVPAALALFQTFLSCVDRGALLIAYVLKMYLQGFVRQREDIEVMTDWKLTKLHLFNDTIFVKNNLYNK